MAKKKRTRKMPAHIVLPNGMWRFIKGKAKKGRVSRKKVKRRVENMVKRRKSGSRSFGGKGMISKGLYSPKGIIASMLIGAGAATLAEKVVPQVIPYQGEAIGFMVGGVGGAAGAFARNALKGMSGGATSASPYGN